jgi:uncharacterized protein involved in exopolysaccharide biosynthesis
MIESKWNSGNGNGHNGNGHNGNGHNGHGHLTGPRTVRDFAAIGFRRRRLILVSFGAIFLGAVLAILAIPARYTARMRILVDTSRINPVISTKPEILQSAQKLSDDELNTEMQVLGSRDILQKAVVGCGLYEPDPWWTSPIAALQAAQFRVMNTLGLAADKDTRIYRAALKLEDKLDVVPMPDSHVIQVSYGSPFPERSKCVLSTLSRAYFDKHLELQRPSRASGAFEKETQAYERKLMNAQAQLVDFVKQDGAISPESQKEIAIKNLNDFEAMGKQTQASVAETRKRLQDLQAQLGSTPDRIVTQVQTNDNAILLQNLKTSLLSLEVQRIDLLEKFAPTYRPVQEIEKQIKQTRDAIAEAEKTPIYNRTTDVNPTTEWIYGEIAKAQADLVGYEARSQALRQAVQTYEAKALRLEQDGWTQQNLLRNVKVNEDNYLLYRHKAEEAKSTELLDQAQVSNVAFAEVPVVPLAPDGLPLLAKLALALLVAGMLSLGVAWVAEYMDRSVRTPDELEVALDLPVLASIPANGHSRHTETHVSGIL